MKYNIIEKNEYDCVLVVECPNCKHRFDLYAELDEFGFEIGNTIRPTVKCPRCKQYAPI